VFGSAVHKFIEVYYRSKDAKLATHQIVQTFKDVDTSPLNREEMHSLEVDKHMAMGIAAAYPPFYKTDFDQFSTFLTEQEFEFPFEGGGDTYGGIIDGLVKDHAGDWWILETKTAAAQTLSGGYFDKVKIDSQVAGYMYGAKCILGEFPKGILYNVIKKPSIRLKKGESLVAFQKRIYEEYTKFGTEKAYFTRQELMLAEHRIKSWYKDTSYLTKQITEKIKSKNKNWIMNTGACNARFGTCEYMPACTSNTYNPILYEKGSGR
tara:strand:+ start:130 stop:921 length:792 start_codon:yes stop_codon:yes gene_type:complete